MRLAKFLIAGMVVCLPSLALASTISVADTVDSEPDAMEFLIGSYTEVLLIGHACKDHGAAGHQAIVERTVKDFVELGMSEEDAASTVEALIATEGPRVAAIIADEAKKSPAGTNLYCTTAYPESVSKLDRARLAIAKEIRKSDQEKETGN